MLPPLYGGLKAPQMMELQDREEAESQTEITQSFTVKTERSGRDLMQSVQKNTNQTF